MSDRRNTLLIIGSIILIIVIATIIALLPKSFGLVSSNPANNTTINVTPKTIELTFSKPVKTKTLDAIFSPNFDYSVEFKDKKIILTPKDFLKNKTTYTLAFSNLESAEGNNIDGVTLSFTLNDQTDFRKILNTLPIYRNDYAILAPTSAQGSKFRLRLYKNGEEAKQAGLAEAASLGIKPENIETETY